MSLLGSSDLGRRAQEWGANCTCHLADDFALLEAHGPQERQEARPEVGWHRHEDRAVPDDVPNQVLGDLKTCFLMKGGKRRKSFFYCCSLSFHFHFHLLLRGKAAAKQE